METVALLPYSHEHYDTLRDIVDAAESVNITAVAEILCNVLGKLFIDYGVHNELGIILLHNHFSMSPTELLVQFGNAAIPWDTASPLRPLENISPSSWRFTSAGLAPYEFRHSQSGQLAPLELSHEKHGEFLRQLLDALVRHDLVSDLGLCTLDDKDINSPASFEFTSGRANITIDVEISLPGEAGSENNIEAIWQFGVGEDGSGTPLVFKKCKTTYIPGDDGEHRTKHTGRVS